jgi:hypothetical protein
MPSGEAFLDGYAFFSEALFRLASIAEAFEQEGEPFELPRPWTQYRQEAERLGLVMIEKFYDHEGGGFFSSGSRHEVLFGRTKPVFDQPLPSANAAALGVLIELGEEDLAYQSLSAMLGWMEKMPQATEALLAAALPLLDLYTPVLADGAASETILAAPEVAAEVVAEVTKAAPKEVSVKLSAREFVAGADGFGHAEIHILVPDGLHLNSNEPPARWLTPTRLDIRPLKSKIDYPAAVNDRFEGLVVIPFRVQLPTGESGAEFEVKVSYQACTESECQLPSERTLDGVVLRG